MRYFRWAVVAFINTSIAIVNMVLVYAIFNMVTVTAWFPAWFLLTTITTVIVLAVAEE